MESHDEKRARFIARLLAAAFSDADIEYRDGLLVIRPDPDAARRIDEVQPYRELPA